MDRAHRATFAPGRARDVVRVVRRQRRSTSGAALPRLRCGWPVPAQASRWWPRLGEASVQSLVGERCRRICRRAAWTAGRIRSARQRVELLVCVVCGHIGCAGTRLVEGGLCAGSRTTPRPSSISARTGAARSQCSARSLEARTATSTCSWSSSHERPARANRTGRGLLTFSAPTRTSVRGQGGNKSSWRGQEVRRVLGDADHDANNVRDRRHGIE